MHRLIVATLLSFGLTAAYAQAPASPAAPAEAAAPAKPAPKAKKKAAVEAKADVKAEAKSEASPAQLAQREKMKTCNKDAKAQDLKGDKRKAFMKDCLKKQ